MTPAEIAAAAAAAAANPAAPVEPTAAAEPVEPAAAVEPPAAAEPGPAPWAKSLEDRFPDEAVRAEVDRYLREEQQPYVTKIESERAEAQGKAWVYDKLEEDPESALREIVTAVWDAEAADRVLQLIDEGFTAEQAAEVAGAEAVAAGVETKPVELPDDVKETVEWAKNERARQAAESAAKAEEREMAAATAELNAWADPLLEAEKDIKRSTLMAYVAAHVGNMESAYAAYRADFPKPEPPKPPAPTLLGGHTQGGIEPARRHSTLAQAAGSVFDAASGK